MGYYLYKKQQTQNGWKYEYSNQDISLAGLYDKHCISSLLLNKIKRGMDRDHSNQPFGWNISINEELNEMGKGDHAIIIDLKPSSKELKSFYELIDVCGYSADGWTPVMLHLQGLYTDEKCPDENSFEKEEADIAKNIFTFLYLRGSVIKGEREGDWRWPGPSSTNSALLFQDAFEHFLKCRQEILARSS